MAEHAEHELIIVRRHEEEEHEAHSSAWKVAHADFMTAMMAFFLIMWLISVTDDQVRKGISEYFNPIRLSQGQTELKGLNKPTTDPNKPGLRKGHADAPADVFNPMKLSEGLSESKALEESEAAAPAPADSGAGASAAAAGAGVAPAPTASAAAQEAGAGTATGEGAAFRNPYALLDALAARYRTAHPVSSSAVVGDDRSPGIDGSEVDRDPFDPVYWQLGTTPAARTETPGKPGTAKAPPDALPDAAAAKPAEPADAAGQAEDGAAPVQATASADGATAVVDTAPPTAPAPAATASGVLKAVASPASPAGVEAPGADRPGETRAVAAATRTNAAAIGAEVATVAASLDAADLPDVTVTATPEGVLVNLTDDADFAMFEIGSAVPNAKIVVLMEALGKALAARSGDVIVRGYTDGRPFRSEVYDNWRLSAARAQMAFYMLTRGGLDEKRVVRIEGYADRGLKVKADPFAAENRRIEILLREDGE